MPTFPDTILNPARQRGDSLADDFVCRVLADETLRPGFYDALGQGGGALWDFVYHNGPDLTATIGPQPAWAKRYWRAEAQAIFARRGAEILMLLGVYSLPYCYAAAQGAAVLAATGRLSGHGSAHARLQETARYVHAALSGTEDEVRHACLQVRLIHAMVRRHLHAKGWAADQDLPVNQEDMAGTNLAFGYLTWRGLRLLGLPQTPAETEAYLGWFAVLGTWLGVEESLTPPDPASCATLASAIERRHHLASPQGVALTQALLAGFAETAAPPAFIQKAPGLMAALLGPHIASILGLPAPDNGYLATLKRLNTFRTFLPALDWLAPSPPKPPTAPMRLA